MPDVERADKTLRLYLVISMLTGYVEDEHIAGAIKAGASGYVIKKSELDELLLGIQAVHRGNPYFSSSIGDGNLTDYLWQLKSNEGRTGYDLLTAREREVLQLIAEGSSNQQDRAGPFHQRKDGGDAPRPHQDEAARPETART